MKKILNIGFMATFLLVLSYSDASAQRRKDKNNDNTTPTEQTEDSQTPKPTTSPNKKSKKADDYFDESGGFKHRLWYGGNVILNFGGSNGESSFTFGVTPMIGYKIVGGLSAGPKFGVIHTILKAYNDRGTISSLGLTNYSVGAFSRFKFLKTFFLHAEHEYANTAGYFINPSDPYERLQTDANGKALKSRQGQQNTYIGAGYNAGGLISYEILLLYNLSPQPQNSLNLPIDIRFGFTYNF